MYLAKKEVQDMNIDASAKMARILFAKRRHERHISTSSTASYLPSPSAMQSSRYDAPLPPIPPPSNPLAVELPAEDVTPMLPRPLQYQHMGSVADMKYSIVSSDEYPQAVNSPTSSPAHQQYPQYPQHQHQYQQRPSIDDSSPHHSNSSFHSSSSPNRPSVDYHRPGSNDQSTNSYNNNDYNYRPHRNTSPAALTSANGNAPPLPPKTPLQQTNRSDSMRRWEMAGVRNTLPYPETDGPPPPVNLARKPEYGT